MSASVNTVEKNFHLTNVAGAEVFEFSETFKIEVKWSKIDSAVFEVEIVDVFGTFDCTNYKYELGSKFSSTTIEPLSKNTYKVTLTAWNPIFLKATFPLKKVQLLNPDFITLFHLPLPEEAMEKLGIQEFCEETFTVFDDIIISYSIRRETATLYFMEMKSDKYNLSDNLSTYQRYPGGSAEFRQVWPKIFEFELKKMPFEKPSSKSEVSTLTFWLEKNAPDKSPCCKVCISEKIIELDVEKVEEYAREKYGNPDYAFLTDDGEIIKTYKDVIEESTKVFKKMCATFEPRIACDALVFHHVLAYIYGRSLQFHGLEMELIKFAKDFEMGDLMSACVTSLENQLNDGNICKITKFAYENGISKLLETCQFHFNEMYFDKTKINKEELRTLTADMVLNIST